jgi:murein DD-endopeptidase MepM/ murein hydrolase activator NlpD
MRLFAAAILIAVFWSMLMPAKAAQSRALDLVLPTDNDALFSGDGAAFYQYVERNYGGVKSTPWQGGQYGFVRDPTDTAGGIVFTRFHEGIDIRSLHRDSRGEPLDEVRAIADGKVMHVNLIAGYSNYGKYIVIEHRWDGSNYYSFYGHLSSIAAQPGETVTQGQRIAVMGYTGTGLDRERAHLHLELDLMFSRQFEAWYDASFKKDPNRNGIYNGMNLAGIDVARLYLALRKNPALTIPEFLNDEEIFYKITLPNSRHFDLPRLYPWMLAGKQREKSSWEVSFARSGVPLRIEPSDRRVTQPELSYTKKSSIDCSYLTRDVISGREANAHLTNYGRQLMRLLTYPD